MKKNTKKALIITVLVLVVLIAAALGVCFKLIPNQTKTFLNTAWEWLNAPLPLLSVSILALCILGVKLFAMSSFGKKQINEFKRESKETRSEFESMKLEYEEKLRLQNQTIESYKKTLDFYMETLVEICKASPNKKVRAIGENLYGEKDKEETND